jgi:hypothetical protein
MMVFGKPFWEVLRRPAVLPFSILAGIDCLMTVIGTFLVFYDRPPEALLANLLVIAGSVIGGLIVGLGVMITLLCTFDIWGAWHPVLQERAFMRWMLWGVWGVAFVYDWGTSFWSLFRFVGSPGDPREWIFIAVASFVICGSTLVISFMTYNERREDTVGSASG